MATEDALRAAPKNRRKTKLRLPKNQNITNTEQIGKWWSFSCKGFPLPSLPSPPPKQTLEYPYSTSQIHVGKHNLPEV